MAIRTNFGSSSLLSKIKTTLINSAIGQALGLATGDPWVTILNTITSIVDYTGVPDYIAEVTLDSTDEYVKMAVPASGYYSTDNNLCSSYSDMASTLGITSSVIKNGTTILGVSGSVKGMSVGSRSGNGTITVTSKLSNYKSLSASNFIVSITSGAYIATDNSGSVTNTKQYSYANGFTVSKSYASSTGVLTLSGLTQTIGHYVSSVWTITATQTLTATVYYIPT